MTQTSRRLTQAALQKLDVRLLIGGSPCTHWSIARKGRETEPGGIGWELFYNYVIALQKFNPDFFLYENNKSMSKSIRQHISRSFGFEPVCINSALVSAQNRQRLYWAGKRNDDGTYSPVYVPQPEDLGILLPDVLDGAMTDKAYALKATYYKSSPANAFDSGHYPQTMSAQPVNMTHDKKAKCLVATYYKSGIRNMVANDFDRKTCVAVEGDHTAFKVKDGRIYAGIGSYPVNLKDGYYTIRKLTVQECKRLQTVPDSYEFPVSNTQAYKMLGNGWTVDVIAHIMRQFTGICDRGVTVLSMYDGMSCGHIALDKLKIAVHDYYAFEIDKYAIQTTMHNYPETIQLGDAFKVREDMWSL